MLAREKNRLGTERAPDVRRHIQNVVELYERQLRELDEQLERCVRADDGLQRKIERLASAPGVGIVAAIALLVEMPELGALNRREAGRLAGLAPVNRDSGKHRGKRMIGGGRPPVRRAIYMAALVAVRHPPPHPRPLPTTPRPGKEKARRPRRPHEKTPARPQRHAQKQPSLELQPSKRLTFKTAATAFRPHYLSIRCELFGIRLIPQRPCVEELPQFYPPRNNTSHRRGAGGLRWILANAVAEFYISIS
jgi:transposase